MRSSTRRSCDDPRPSPNLSRGDVPLALAVILWFHPPGGETVYAGIRDDVGEWLFVHTAFLFFIPLIAAVVYLMLQRR